MKSEPNTKKDLLNRLSRAKGQLEGVERMVVEDRACLDSVQQISAVRSALAKVGVELLKNEASVCAKKPESGEFDRLIEELFKLK